VISTGRPKPGIMGIREALGITERPNTELLLSNGCVLYDSKGDIIWQSIIPTEFVIKFHEFTKSYPEGVYFYAAGDHTLAINDKWVKKLKEENGPNERIIAKEKLLEEILSGNRMVNKVSFFFYKCSGAEGKILNFIKKK